MIVQKISHSFHLLLRTKSTRNTFRKIHTMSRIKIKMNTTTWHMQSLTWNKSISKTMYRLFTTALLATMKMNTNDFLKWKTLTRRKSRLMNTFCMKNNCFRLKPWERRKDVLKAETKYTWGVKSVWLSMPNKDFSWNWKVLSGKLFCWMRKKKRNGLKPTATWNLFRKINKLWNYWACQKMIKSNSCSLESNCQKVNIPAYGP